MFLYLKTVKHASQKVCPVRFYRSDGTDWVANFRPGWTSLTRVVEFNSTSNLLVIASGTGYLVNPNDTKPISVFGVGYSQIFQTSNNRTVLQDQTNLTIIESDGTYWNTERISWDGLAEIRVESNVVSGLAYNPTHRADEWVRFTYDLDTKTLIGGSYPRLDRKKPWWKIW
jgi:hypothetical protein